MRKIAHLVPGTRCQGVQVTWDQELYTYIYKNDNVLPIELI